METIEQRISELESRIGVLEAKILNGDVPTISTSSKEKTLREIVKGKRFKNGQEQIAAIVGYHEKVLGQPIQKDQIKEVWQDSKMNGEFAAVYLTRAKDTLVRILSDGTCDLTQTGEEFFEALINSEF